MADTNVAAAPPFRRLRVYAFDPSLDTKIETAVINQLTLNIPWEIRAKVPSQAEEAFQKLAACEDLLKPGPVGDYLEVVDFDPASGCFYEPVDLNAPYVLAQDGLAPSEGCPQFHQQMVYAVAMSTIRNFERALGRLALWSPRRYSKEAPQASYVHRLRIYPHAMREANAYYSPQKKALLFGYFSSSFNNPGSNLPGGVVFTCLSHDVVAHETTHALLDGIHPYFVESTNADALAFHEALADIVALFQHFSFPEVLHNQIAKTRGDLASQSLLGELAQQFGQAIGQHGALRNAIGQINPATGKWEPLKPDPVDYQKTMEPHARGAILVSAIFDAFLSIYKTRIADLLRIATDGTGRLPEGEIHPDLVRRLAKEASKSAQHVLNICIRALDYCLPFDMTFGDYLRALITSDYDLVPDDDLGYRVAFIEAFRRRGIYPPGVRSLAIDSLRWQEPEEEDQKLLHEILHDSTLNVVKSFAEKWNLTSDRRTLWDLMQKNCKILYGSLKKRKDAQTGKIMGIDLSSEAPFYVFKVRPARRIGPDGQFITELVIEIVQRRPAFFDRERQQEADKAWREGVYGKPVSPPKGSAIAPDEAFSSQSSARTETQGPDFWFRGGCTLLVNAETGKVRYCISKSILSEQRLERQREFLGNPPSASLRATYFDDQDCSCEPFAMLHREPV